jgi:hypothetical protein
MRRTSAISIAVLSLLLGTTALAYAQHEQQGDNQKQEQRSDKKDEKSDKPKPDKQARPVKPQPAEEAKPQRQPATRPEQQQQQLQQPDRNTQPQRERAQQQPHDRNNTQQQQQTARLPQQRQKQLVDQQQQRLTQYRQQLDQQQRVLEQQSAQLQQQKRSAQYRFQQDYLAHLRQQQVFLNDHHPDYDRDPFFFTVSIYGYNRGGRHYEINQYGADLLRQAVNFGYEEGFRAGQADREDHWRFSYEDSYAYQDANYGYNGYYVDRDDYNYYFREGFRRGYDDGFYSRSQYGRYTDRSYTMNDSVLTVVLNFQSLR